VHDEDFTPGFFAPLVALVAVILLGVGMALVANKPKPQPQATRLCEAQKPFVLAGTEYPAGKYYPCRWLNLEQDI
jgi:hypothetical protein